MTPAGEDKVDARGEADSQRVEWWVDLCLELLRLIVNINKRVVNWSGGSVLSTLDWVGVFVEAHIAVSSASQLHFFHLVAQFHRPELFLNLFALFSYLIVAIFLLYMLPFKFSYSWRTIFPPKSQNDSKSVYWCTVALRNEWVAIVLIYDPKLD